MDRFAQSNRAKNLRLGEIRIDKVSVDYPLYRRLVLDRMREVLGALFPSLKPPTKRVLNDIDLVIEPGEIVGLIGVNGAGKTTLLKVISSLISPTAGTVAVGGKVMALLAMGLGFRSNFTGRENVYYGGLLMGMSRSAVDLAIDGIVEFAELGEAFDQPYFTYSSGMRARLGFALATAVPADIVILDETLATGDRKFVARCYKRIQDIRRSGRTILFVSHNLGEVARMTERVILLDQGKAVFDGPTGDGLAQYEEILSARSETPVSATLAGINVELSLLNEDGQPSSLVHIGAPASLRLIVETEKNIGDVWIYIRVAELETDHLVCYIIKDRALLENFDAADYNVSLAKGKTEIIWSLPHWVAGEGQYLFDVYIGPPVDARSPDVSGGRSWRRALLATAVYFNPYLKGAGALLEMPINDVTVRQLGDVQPL